jgi:hypothetical protein
MEQGPTVIDLGCRSSGLFYWLNILDKLRGARLHLIDATITMSPRLPEALGARPGPPADVVPVYVAVMAGTTTVSSAAANPVVARQAQLLVVSG